MGGITGLDRGAGSILGMLLRGYTSRLQEEESRRALENQAGMLGLSLPPSEDRSYLNRVLAPNAWRTSAQSQKSLLDAFQEMQIKAQLEQQKQGFIGQRQLGIEEFRASAANALTSYKESQSMERLKFGEREAMERLKYSKATPDTLPPSTIARNNAAAAASNANARYQGTFADMLQRMAGQGWGGPALSGTIGAPGIPTTQPPSPTDTPQAQYEYVPSFSSRGVSLDPKETIARKAAVAAAEKHASEQASTLNQEEAAAISGMEFVSTMADSLAHRARNNPDLLGIGKQTTRGLTSYLPQSMQGVVPDALTQTPETVQFYKDRDYVIQGLRSSITGAQASQVELDRFDQLAGDVRVSDPEIFAADIEALKRYATSIVQRRLQLRQTPRGSIRLNETLSTPLPTGESINDFLQRKLGQ